MNILTHHLSRAEQAVFDGTLMNEDRDGYICTFFKAKRYTPLYWIGALYLLISLVLRLVLFVAFGPPATVPLWQLPPVLGHGLVNDLIELLYLLFPFSLFLLLPPNECTARYLAVSLWE